MYVSSFITLTVVKNSFHKTYIDIVHDDSGLITVTAKADGRLVEVTRPAWKMTTQKVIGLVLAEKLVDSAILKLKTELIKS